MMEIKNFYTDKTKGVNIFHAFLIPHQFMNGIYSLIKARKEKNESAVLDSKLKLITTSVNTVYITSSIFAIFAQIGVLFSYTANTLALVSPISGLAAATISGFIECKNIRRQIRFLSKCKKDLIMLKSGSIDKKNILFLQKYVGNSSGIKLENLAKLSNRVSPWYAETMAIELPRLLDDIHQSKDLSLQKASLKKVITLISNAEIQTKKKLISQSLTLIATALVISGFVCILLAQPYLIPIVLFTANAALILFKYIIYSGTNKHIGWEFRVRECVPVWIQIARSYIFRSANDLKEAQVRLP